MSLQMRLPIKIKLHLVACLRHTFFKEKKYFYVINDNKSIIQDPSADHHANTYAGLA